MLSYDLSDEQRLFRDTVREFAEGEIGPVAEELDREGRFPVELVRGAAELGLMGIPLPEEWGGAGAGTVSLRDRRRGAGPRRQLVRDHGRGAHLAGHDADPPVRRATSSAAGGCPIWPPAGRWARSG